MTPETATALLAEMVRTPQCTACGKLNPPTIGPVGLFDCDTAPVHEGCLATLDWLATVTESVLPLPSEEECCDAIATVVDYAATIARLERELAARDAAYLNLAREMDARGFELRAAHAETSRAKGDRIEALALVERVEAEAREQDSVAYALRRVIEKLPRCRGCMEPATYDYDGDGRCDDHADPSVCVENPWADALRAIKKVAT